MTLEIVHKSGWAGHRRVAISTLCGDICYSNPQLDTPRDMGNLQKEEVDFSDYEGYNDVLSQPWTVFRRDPYA